MRFEVNELYLSVVVSCVDLKPFLPVFVVELPVVVYLPQPRPQILKYWQERLQIDTGDNNWKV